MEVIIYLLIENTISRSCLRYVNYINNVLFVVSLPSLSTRVQQLTVYYHILLQSRGIIHVFSRTKYHSEISTGC